jgi:hypothetical protein
LEKLPLFPLWGVVLAGAPGDNQSVTEVYPKSEEVDFEIPDRQESTYSKPSIVFMRPLAL